MNEERNYVVEKKKSPILTFIVILTCIVIIGTCIYFIYNSIKLDNDNSNKEENNVNSSEVENKIDKENSDSEGNKENLTDSSDIEQKMDVNMSVLEYLIKENIITIDKEYDSIVWKNTNIDVILNYGKIENKNVKIHLVVKGENPYYDCKFIIYVDNNEFTLLDDKSLYSRSTVDSLIRYLKIDSNEIGILFINTVEYFREYSMSPFILIYNKDNKFDYINDNITTTFYDKWEGEININKNKITYDNDNIYYYKYNLEKEKNNFCNGMTDVSYVRYDGVKEHIMEIFNNVYIHDQVC